MQPESMLRLQTYNCSRNAACLASAGLASAGHADEPSIRRMMPKMCHPNMARESTHSIDAMSAVGGTHPMPDLSI